MYSHDQSKAKHLFGSFMINAYAHTTLEKVFVNGSDQTFVPKSNPKT